MINISSADIITREELYELVWKEPITVFSRRNDLSEYAVRKACKAMKVPTPKAGYWENIRLGKKIDRQALPDDPSAITYLDLSGISKAKVNMYTNYQANPSARVLHPLVQAAQLRLTTIDKRVTHKYYGLLSCSKNELDIRVSETMIVRAIRWMNCFIDSLEKRDHSITIENGNTYVVINGQPIKVYLRELTKSAVPKSKWFNAPLIPTGLLVFKMDGYWGKEWRDGSTTLEVQLIHIIEELEGKARKLIEKAFRKEAENLAAREIEKVALLKRNLVEKELDDFKQLLESAERWQKAQSLKAYIAAWKANAQASKEMTPEMADKIEWASKKAEWYDPFSHAQDTLFSNIDKDTLRFKS